MNQFMRCLFSPRLYKVYKHGHFNAFYEENPLEKWGDKVIKSAYSFYNISFYASPVLILYLFMKRNVINMEDSKGLILYLGGFGCLVTASLILRGLGRALNPNYIRFLDALQASRADREAYLTNLRMYEFEFGAWPVTFSVPCIETRKFFDNPFKKTANPHLPAYKRVPVQLLAYIAKHTFGIGLIYPGSMGFVHYLLSTTLKDGRHALVEQFSGKRTKIGTADGNTIDTMLVDHRGLTDRGDTLVICCEGNGGFYELGIMSTPIKGGYSALGWNHPGFATSTGCPFPSQEQAAVDGVVRFAVEDLGFNLEDVVLYGWSIGGYTAAWAAVNYPDVKGLVLDATFDDLLPLALNYMPPSWEALVREVVRVHVNLDVAGLVEKYPGPITLLRRTDDEIICLRPGQIASNRANDLLIRLIHSRHPEIAPEDDALLRQYLAMPARKRLSLQQKLTEDKNIEAMGLIQTYLRDVKSSHCLLLPEKDFNSATANFGINVENPL